MRRVRPKDIGIWVPAGVTYLTGTIQIRASFHFCWTRLRIMWSGKRSGLRKPKRTSPPT